MHTKHKKNTLSNEVLMHNFRADSVTVTQWAWREKLREVQLFQEIFSNVEENAGRKFYVSYDCIDIFQTVICVGVFLEKE